MFGLGWPLWVPAPPISNTPSCPSHFGSQSSVCTSVLLTIVKPTEYSEAISAVGWPLPTCPCARRPPESSDGGGGGRDSTRLLEMVSCLSKSQRICPETTLLSMTMFVGPLARMLWLQTLSYLRVVKGTGQQQMSL